VPDTSLVGRIFVILCSARDRRQLRDTLQLISLEVAVPTAVVFCMVVEWDFRTRYLESSIS
jgi:hypothetical protein